MKQGSPLFIAKLDAETLGPVAVLHKNHMDQGFLGTLGLSFLTLLYRTMIDSDSCVCLTAASSQKGEIAGFIAGALNVKSFYREFLKKNALRASVLLLPQLLKPRTTKMIAETLFYPVRMDDRLPAAELLSIVVHPSCRNMQVGRHLFEALSRAFQDAGVWQFRTVVGSHLGSANRFYGRMGGLVYTTIEVHGRHSSNVYVWNI